MAKQRNIDPSIDDIGINAIPGSRPVDKPKPKRPAAGAAQRRDADAPPVREQAHERRRPAPKQHPRRESYNFVSFVRDYRTHLSLGVIFCLVAFAMVVCGISFLFNHGADQSVTHARTVSEIVASGDIVQNAGGPGGAKFAEWLLVDGFGIGSFILAVYLFLLGLALMKLKRCNFWSLSFRCLFSACAISVIVGLLTYNRADVFHLGGTHGYFVNHLLLQYTGALGAYCTTVALLGILVAVFLKPLTILWNAMSKTFSKHKAQLHHEPAAETVAKPEFDILDDNAAGEEPDESDDSDADESATTAAAEEAAKIAAEHARFMPPPALDDLDSEDGEDEEPEPGHNAVAAAAMAAAAPVAPVAAEIPATVAAAATAAVPEVTSPAAATEPQAKPAYEAETVALPEQKGEPEMIIVNATHENTVEDTKSAQITHGDHIGLDQPYDQRAQHSNYVFPPLDLLIERPNPVIINEEEQAANKSLIVNALRSYDIEILRIEATIGPTVTLYEIVPAEGTRIAKIKSLEDDIAMSLSALGIRIIAPIPGKGTIGIEVPNRNPQIVSMRKMLESPAFTQAKAKMKLPLALGATVSNDFFITDLAKMPHLLVAGATGQGKSVGLNCIITSLLYSRHPDELKFVLVDPKMVEFTLYQRIANQYLAKLPEEDRSVITDPQKVIATLNSLCVEMDKRYELLSEAEVRGVEAYNERFMQRRLNPEKGHRYMPYIVMIVDEFADLIMTAGKDISVPIGRIAQKARAVGMHMIIATQRPSTDIITGMIKANFPARIAFKTSQSIDSKTILDRPGAHRLNGRGDMLTLIDGRIERVQCALVDTEEVEAICMHIGAQPGFTMPLLLPEVPTEGGSDGPAEIGATTDEFRRCAMFIASQTQASITMLQRKFEIGFNKAGRFMDQMQTMGIVGPANGANPRQVLMTPDAVQRLFD